MAIDPAAIHVLVPDRWGGLTVTTVAELWERCDDEDDLDSLLTNAGMDAIDRPTVSSRRTLEQAVNVLVDKIQRVDALNRTGNSDAYWEPL